MRGGTVSGAGPGTHVVVAAMLAGDPHQGGAQWATLQWVLGLRELGCTVTVVDQLAPGRALDDEVSRCASGLVAAFGLGATVAVLDDHGATWGMDRATLDRRMASADVVLNLSGRLRAVDLVAAVPVRVFVDLDPGFVQVWAVQGHDFGFAAHTHFATVGQAVGEAGCTTPDAGQRWSKVLPPVVLAHWPACPPPARRRATTVANWRSYGSATWDGLALGQKVHSFRALIGLGERSPVPLEVAVELHPDEHADRSLLAAHRWQIVDPREVAGTPDAYRRYVQGSWAEIGVAKSGYVVGRTGWISDRTAEYLASGRPVVLQDTGSHPLHGRDGVRCFADVDGAVAALEELVIDYDHHARAARELAVELFDARAVLRGLLAEVGV